MVQHKNLINLLVRTKFYWSWVEGPVLIVRTCSLPIPYFPFPSTLIKKYLALTGMILARK
jgi:hypothetical protein